MCVFVKSLDVKVWSRYNEIKDLILLLSEPVTPALVPAFHKNSIETVLRGKVYISADIVALRTMSFSPTISIGTHAGDHLPPYSHVLDRTDPRNIIKGTRFIKIKNQSGREHLTGIIHHHHGPPRRCARSTEPPSVSSSIGSQIRLETEVLIIKYKSHRRIIDQGSLMDIDVKSAIRLHLKRSLDCRRSGYMLRGTLHKRSRHKFTNLRQTGLPVIILLSIIVSCKPPSLMVASHPELCQFIKDSEIPEAFLLRKLIPESQTIIKKTESDNHFDTILLKSHRKLVVMVADPGFLAPDRAPCLVESRTLNILNAKTVMEVQGIIAYPHVVLRHLRRSSASELVTKHTWHHHIPAFVLKSIVRRSVFGQSKGHFKVSVRTGQSLCFPDRKTHQKGCQ